MLLVRRWSIATIKSETLHAPKAIEKEKIMNTIKWVSCIGLITIIDLSLMGCGTREAKTLKALAKKRQVQKVYIEEQGEYGSYYEQSSLDAYLNQEFLERLAEPVRDCIADVSIEVTDLTAYDEWNYATHMIKSVTIF